MASGLWSCRPCPDPEVTTSAVTSQWPRMTPAMAKARERVHGAVPVRRGGGVDLRGEAAGAGQGTGGHWVTPAGSPSAMRARLRRAMPPGLK